MGETGARTDDATSTDAAEAATADEPQSAGTVSFESQGVRCEGDLYLPRYGDDPNRALDLRRKPPEASNGPQTASYRGLTRDVT